MKSRIILIAAIIALPVIGSCIVTLPMVGAQGTYALQYNLRYTQPAYPGATIILVNDFTNSGTVTERVTGLTITLDFSTYTTSSGLPLTVPVGQKEELNMTVQIPSSASVMSHTATALIGFQYQDPSTSQWVNPSLSPLTVQGSVNITANPTGFAIIGFAIFGIIAALAFAVVFLVVRMRRKPKPEATPPAPMPLPSPPATP